MPSESLDRCCDCGEAVGLQYGLSDGRPCHEDDEQCIRALRARLRAAEAQLPPEGERWVLCSDTFLQQIASDPRPATLEIVTTPDGPRLLLNYDHPMAREAARWRAAFEGVTDVWVTFKNPQYGTECTVANGDPFGTVTRQPDPLTAIERAKVEMEINALRAGS